MVEKMAALAKISETGVWAESASVTDVSAEQFWTVVTEIETPSLEKFMAMGQNDDDRKAFEAS